MRIYRGATAASEYNHCIDINSATIEHLQEIIHTGPERAEEIIQLRPFKSI
jgi:competence protein ComEC